MSRFNTGNPLGSGDPRDLDDNAKNMDLAVNSDEPSWRDRFGRDRKSFEGMEREFDEAQASRETRFNNFMEDSAYQFIGDYGPGIEITEYNQLIRDSNGEFWRVSGQVDLPYVTTGAGIPEDDALVPAGDAVLRQDLADPDKGASMVAFLPSGSGAVQRDVRGKLRELASVKDFGALGNWDASTQTGADDTVAIQNAINYLASLPTKRAGGVRVLQFPAGNYKISALTIPANMSFGIDFIGAGKNATTLWADPANADPAITSEIEFVNFKSMSLFGALSETGSSASWKTVFYRGKQASNRADIDVRFSDCLVGYSVDFVQAYGRGVVFDAGTAAVYSTNLLHIVADPSTTFTGSTNDTAFTGMRHYSFLGMRADVVSFIVKITGTGTQKDHIHGIQVVGCDFSACDRLIGGDDATIRHATICGNTSLDSFAGGVVTVKSVTSSVDSGNMWCNAHSEAVLPSSNPDCIQWVWKTTGAIAGLTVIGTTVPNLSYGVVSAGASSNNIKIIGCNFPQAFVHSDGNATHWVFNSPLNCDGLVIGGNTFTASSMAGTYYLYDATVQTSNRTRTFANVAPWSWADMRIRFTPTLLINGAQSTTSPSIAHGRKWFDDTYCYWTVMLHANIAETTGNLGIGGLGVTAIAENAIATGTYGGDGAVVSASGFASEGNVFAPAKYNPSTQEIELYVESGLSRSRLTAAMKSGPISLYVTGKCRIQ